MSSSPDKSKDAHQKAFDKFDKLTLGIRKHLFCILWLVIIVGVTIPFLFFLPWDSTDNVIKNAEFLLTVWGFMIGIVVTRLLFKRTKVAEENLKNQNEIITVQNQSLQATLFKDATNMLSNPNVAIALHGVTLLGDLLDTPQREKAIEIFRIYLVETGKTEALTELINAEKINWDVFKAHSDFKHYKHYTQKIKDKIIQILNKKKAMDNLNLTGAFLPLANLEKTKLKKVHFTHANLNEANFKEATLNKVDFTNATLNNTNFQVAKLTEVRFTTPITLDEANFAEATLKKVHFTKATLNEVYFYRAHLKKVDFFLVTLNEVYFTNATLKKVHFTGATLKKVDFSEATLKKVNFTYDNSNKISLLESEMNNIDFSQAREIDDRSLHSIQILRKKIVTPNITLSSAQEKRLPDLLDKINSEGKDASL